MKYINLGSSNLQVPAIAIGCMRLTELSYADAEKFVRLCVEQGANFFDHADIYGDGECERIFGQILSRNPEMREKIFLQSKCGIVPGRMYNLSKEHILASVDGILNRLQTDHLDMLLLHRPDALTEPEEVAAAFDELESCGKVKRFGVSNQNPMQIELLKKCVKQPLLINQLQFSIPVANMVSSGMEVNMTSSGSVVRDGGVLDYCRLHDITIQAWSPFQQPEWKGTFIGSPDYPELNQALGEIAERHNSTSNAVAAAWILRHPAHIQVICGSMNERRVMEVMSACDISLSREEWYELYLKAGHILP